MFKHNFGSKTKKEELKKRKRNDEQEVEEDEEEILDNPLSMFGLKDEDVFRLENHIYFTCDVSQKSINKLVKLIYAANREFQILKATCNNAKVEPEPVYLHITSLGGDLFAGFRAIDIIRTSKIPIHTIVEGYAVSAASLMYLAGSKRYMMPNAYILIHQLTSYCEAGKFEELKDEFENNNKLMEHLYDFYIKESKGTLTKKKIEDILKRDIYWNFDSCKKYNLVDELFSQNI